MWSAFAIAPLLFFLLGVVVALDAQKSRRPISETISNAFACLICAGLPLAVLGLVLISDFRKWFATRKDRLTIYESGFVYENEARALACRWDEIKDIKFRLVPSYSRAFPGTKVRVIRAVAKTDGAVIAFAETLNLVKITRIIDAAREKL
jgi:hypothetical protein